MLFLTELFLSAGGALPARGPVAIGGPAPVPRATGR